MSSQTGVPCGLESLLARRGGRSVGRLRGRTPSCRSTLSGGSKAQDASRCRWVARAFVLGRAGTAWTAWTRPFTDHRGHAPPARRL